jgi:hypothetical protein
MKKEAELSKLYCENTPVFRKLFSACLVEDAKLEQIDIAETEKKIMAIIHSDEKCDCKQECLCLVMEHPMKKELMTDLRYKVMGFLNALFFSMPLSDHWWYEYFHRIEKLVTIMVFVERENLKSFDGHPTPQFDDCPQCFAYIMEKINHFKTVQKPIFKRKFSELMKETLKGTVTDYYWEPEKKKMKTEN